MDPSGLTAVEFHTLHDLNSIPPSRSPPRVQGRDRILAVLVQGVLSAPIPERLGPGFAWGSTC